MARSENNLNAVFQDTANAIRSKTGKNGLIIPRDFADEIDSIETGIEPSGTLDISENGTYDVTDKSQAVVAVPDKLLPDSDVLILNVCDGVPSSMVGEEDRGLGRIILAGGPAVSTQQAYHDKYYKKIEVVYSAVGAIEEDEGFQYLHLLSQGYLNASSSGNTYVVGFNPNPYASANSLLTEYFYIEAGPGTSGQEQRKGLWLNLYRTNDGDTDHSNLFSIVIDENEQATVNYDEELLWETDESVRVLAVYGLFDLRRVLGIELGRASDGKYVASITYPPEMPAEKVWEILDSASATFKSIWVLDLAGHYLGALNLLECAIEGLPERPEPSSGSSSNNNGDYSYE